MFCPKAHFDKFERKDPEMGVYYHPVEDILNGSVAVEYLNTHNYDEAMRQLPNGHHLYALCDRLIFKQAACVDAKEEFEEFFRQYKEGYLISFQLICLPEEAHKRSY